MQSQPRLSTPWRGWLPTVLVLVVLGGVVPVVIASHYGALGIPRSDDWSYLLTVFRWVETGRLQFNNWVSMTLLGQMLLAAPIVAVGGRDITALQLLTTGLGLVGLFAVAALGRQLVRVPWAGLLVAALVAVGPMWGPLAVSFMTDIPAFAFTMVAAAVGVAAFRRDEVSLPLVAASMALGFVGFAIRQYAIVVVIAVAVTAIWALLAQGDRRRARTVFLFLVGAGVLALALLAFWHAIPESKTLSPKLPSPHGVSVTLIKGAGFLRVVAFVISPVLLIVGPVRVVRRAWRSSDITTLLVAGLVLAWLVGIAIHVPRQAFVGNYVSPDGVLSRDVLPGLRHDLFPDAVWTLLIAYATLAATVLVLAAVPAVVGIGARWRDRDLAPHDRPAAFLAIAILGYATAYGLAMLTDLPVYDRYVLPVIPLAALLLWRSSESPAWAETATDAGTAEPTPRAVAPRVRAGAVVAVLLVAGIGLAFTIDSASYDGTRWAVAKRVTAMGWTPRQVNGGFEWVNYYRGRKQARRGRRSAGPKGPPTSPLKTAGYCVSLFVNPTRVRTQVVARGRSAAPTRPTERILAVRSRKPCTPGGKATTKR